MRGRWRHDAKKRIPKAIHNELHIHHTTTYEKYLATQTNKQIVTSNLLRINANTGIREGQLILTKKKAISISKDSRCPFERRGGGRGGVDG